MFFSCVYGVFNVMVNLQDKRPDLEITFKKITKKMYIFDWQKKGRTQN